MIVNNTNHHVTNNGIDIHSEKETLDEVRRSEEEEEEDNQVYQNWSRRHINKAGKNAGQTKPNMFQEEPEELEAEEQKPKKDEIDVDNDNRDNDDDFSKDS